MTTLAVNWNPDENFWTLHPAVKAIKIFGDFYAQDKSKGKEKTSKIMWALAFLLDPNDKNPYKNTAYQEKKDILAKDWVGLKGFTWDDPFIKELEDTYLDLCVTVAEKELVRFEHKLYQRGEFLAATDYTLDYYDDREKLQKGTADQLDKMMVNTGKLFDQLQAIKEKISTEAARGNLRGGEVESAAEEGLI